MTDAAIISGQLVDAKNVGVHKSLRLYIDVPQELAARVIEKLGWPTMTTPIPVAIARLNQESEVMPDTAERSNTDSASGDKTQPPSVSAKQAGAKRWEDYSPAQQAGILCNDPVFQAYICDAQPKLWEIIGKEVAEDNQPPTEGHFRNEVTAEIIRTLCDVNSRSEIIPGHDAAKQWQQITDRFRAWKEAGL